jgi:glycosyltransferase involved in cell wall biosynthesis
MRARMRTRRRRLPLQMAERAPDAVRSVAMISSIALALGNFRGPLIADMVARGLRVYALAPDHDEGTRAAVRRFGGIPVDMAMDRTGMHPLRDLVNMIRLAGTLRRLRPDMSFGFFIKPVIFGTLAARLAGVKRRFAMVAGLGYVFTPDGSPDSGKRKLLRTLVASLYRFAFRRCDRVFFQNADDVAEFTGRGLIEPERVVCLNGTGVDLQRLQPTPPPTSPPTFLLMARMLREKGIVEFVEAARIVRARHPAARFVLLGGTDPNPGGLSRDQLEAWAAAGDVVWQDHVDDVLPWIADSSVFVLPSWREGKPRSTQEAMAVGRPIVTTDAPGCRDTVEEGVNGYKVPVRDAGRLADAMMRFVDDPALIARMGAESRRLAEQLFDVRVINRVMLSAMGIDQPLDSRSGRAAVVSEGASA